MIPGTGVNIWINSGGTEGADGTDAAAGALFLLFEDGGRILLEDGGSLLLEEES